MPRIFLMFTKPTSRMSKIKYVNVSYLVTCDRIGTKTSFLQKMKGVHKSADVVSDRHYYTDTKGPVTIGEY